MKLSEVTSLLRGLNIVRAPLQISPDDPLIKHKPSVFLAGSIEQDTAENWQEEFTDECGGLDLTILNPRREVWDASLEQSSTNPQFVEQVEWELTALELADWIVMYFDPNTKSPISLLELGLFAKSGKMLVCCPQGFWRKGNVDIVCQQNGIPQFDSLPELIDGFLQRVKKVK